jgi:hypothetical protein
MPDTEAKARLLIEIVSASLAKGIKHTRLDGTPLTTVKEVVEALLEDGEIIIDADPED